MAGILYFAAFIVLGSLISNAIFNEQPAYIRVWCGAVIGFLCVMWLVVPFAFVLGFTVTSNLLALLLMILIYLFIRFFYKRGAGFKLSYDGNEKVLCLTAIPIFLLIAYLLYTHVLASGKDGGYFGGQSTFGDLSLHLGIITSISEQGTFPPEYSIFPGKLLSYPFLVNSLSSSMHLLGTSLRWSVLMPSFVMVLVLAAGFFILANEIIKHKYAAALSTILFFFNGGFGFIYFMDGIRKNPANFTRMFTEWYKTPTNYNEHFIRWSNTICDMIIPQRTIMAGWTIVVFAFWLLYKALNENKRVYFIYSGIVAGLMPIIHTHSFLAFGIISVVWSITHVLNREDNNTRITTVLRWSSAGLLLVVAVMPGAGWFALSIVALAFSIVVITCINNIDSKEFKDYVVSWICFLVPVIVLALPQLLFWTFPQSSGEGFLKLQRGWMANEGDIWPWFWIKNIGVVMLLIVPAILAANRKLLNIVLGPVVLFAVSNLIVFQPNNYDNNKLLYIWYIFMVITVSGYIVNIYKAMHGIYSRWCIVIIIVVLATFSGVLTIGREIKSAGIQNYSKSQIEAAEYIVNNTPKDALFISGDQHLNPAAALAGRKIYSGAPLYLYFHGVNYGKRAEEIKRMFQNQEELKKLAGELNIDYIFFSSYEKSKYGIDASHFERNYQTVFHQSDIYIFAVSERAKKMAANQ